MAPDIRRRGAFVLHGPGAKSVVQCVKDDIDHNRQGRTVGHGHCMPARMPSLSGRPAPVGGCRAVAPNLCTRKLRPPGRLPRERRHPYVALGPRTAKIYPVTYGSRAGTIRKKGGRHDA